LGAELSVGSIPTWVCYHGEAATIPCTLEPPRDRQPCAEYQSKTRKARDVF